MFVYVKGEKSTLIYRQFKTNIGYVIGTHHVEQEKLYEKETEEKLKTLTYMQFYLFSIKLLQTNEILLLQ